jgi:hypothetical protein
MQLSVPFLNSTDVLCVLFALGSTVSVYECFKFTKCPAGTTDLFLYSHFKQPVLNYNKLRLYPMSTHITY